MKHCWTKGEAAWIIYLKDGARCSWLKSREDISSVLQAQPARDQA
jgi:hypothetical protein